MLQIKEVSKEYRTGSYVQKALDHISLSLRDNEFVAILGPSGSGKTTLLNLIGGLDRYDSGDLVINGTSTKEYHDKDWDAYRNHSVGFIFQSYNLIPHQTILANVELALTIAGISKKERTRRAKEALERVGLKEHIHKLPNQLSGGQMQRVAIARALINEPTVLLADEPTGALDSETSIQVMELLKEVAKDRLVVMVTHNPELAKDYANRIVELHDGKITSDSNPFTPEESPVKDKRRLGKASMSFFTALGLSFMNLRTKLSRTLLVSFAGSIGIIGIAMILALSTGTNTYISNIQRETLSEYPLQLQKTTIDLSSLFSSESNEQKPSGDQVTESQTIKSLFSTATTNDLGAFKEYLETQTEKTDRLARSVEYRYSISPLIFLEQDERVIQVHPNNAFSALGMGSSFSMGSSYFNMVDVFQAMPSEPELYEDQYDVKAGRWPKEDNEIVLVLSRDGKISDMTLYSMGLKEYSLLEEMIQLFMSGGRIEKEETGATYNYEDFLDISFRLVKRSDLYTYDDTYGVWTDRSEDSAYLKQLVKNSEELKIVGVVKPREDASIAMLDSGLNYMPSLVVRLLTEAAESAPVRAQQADPTVNLLTGRPFDEEGGSALSQLSSMFSIDEEAIKNAFGFDQDVLGFDFSDLGNMEFDLSELLDSSDLSQAFSGLSDEDLLSMLSLVKINLSAEQLGNLASDLLTAYRDYVALDPATDYANLPAAIRSYLASDEAKATINANTEQIFDDLGERIITRERIEELTGNLMTHFSEYLISSAGFDLDAWIEQYRAGEVELSELTDRLIELIPSYLQTEEARLLLEEEINSLREELSSPAISGEALTKLFSDLADGYEAYALQEGLPQLSGIADSFSSFLGTPEAGQLIGKGVADAIDTSALEKQLSKDLTESFSDLMESILPKLMSRIAGALSDTVASVAQKIPSAFTIDPEAFSKAIKVNMEDGELRSLLSSLMSGESSTYEGNLANFGYADLAKPDEIVIYPKSFESKAELIAMIDSYNDEMRKEGNENKVIHYVDLVGTMMNSITEIVDAISYVLIAFVSVSLIVSSIMIGVITYISVLERRKEIGILRAIGASKHNVASVFNAETFIIGALSGLIGVVITWLLLIPSNILIHNLSKQSDLNAILPLPAALALILLSIVLTLIGGFIPSRKAAKSDPVTALRTE